MELNFDPDMKLLAVAPYQQVTPIDHSVFRYQREKIDRSWRQEGLLKKKKNLAIKVPVG